MNMNILIINGSPKGNKSNTYILTKNFVDGLKNASQNASVEELTLSELESVAAAAKPTQLPDALNEEP